MCLSIGIDWADKSHTLCIRELETRRILAECEIINDASGIARLENMVRLLNNQPLKVHALWGLSPQ